ncbi:hypothetical protein PHJA_000337800 [Phtheirospermum japonicum]|uniref:Uncharacterized protein n=1 Tax=Phtheirospermum japonicum TaxID=374723 RepID=A0A830BDB1_9LAMI|nr:hypothetical protein PHJA_000337800 [Phtheirospermum japonicum]
MPEVMDYAAYCDPVKAMCEVHAFALFPPESDFSMVCSCRKCLVKIKKLNDFENYARFTTSQVTECFSQMNDAMDRCLYISSSLRCATILLDLLHNNLKAVDNKLGFESTLEKNTKLKDNDWLLRARVVSSGMFSEFKEYEEEEEKEACIADADRIIKEINSGLWSFRHTNVKVEAHYILNKILKLETNDKATKKEKLERQIKSRPSTKTDSKGQDNGHSSSGLEGVLEFLIDKVNSFKKRWGEQYAPLTNPPCGRSCQKRKRRDNR